MKVVLDRNTILDALHKVQSVINPRSPSPVLSNVLIKAENELVTLFGTDIDVSIKVECPAQVHTPGTTTLQARRIAGIFKEMNSPEIEVEVGDDDLAHIRSGGSFFKLVGLSEKEFPRVPTFEGGKEYTVEQADFKEMLQKTMYAASEDESRPVLNGVLVSLRDEKMTVVATDGRRLALVEHELEFPKENEVDFVLPSKTVSELTRTLADSGEMTIQVLDTQVVFHCGNMVLATKVIEGQYPNFRQVIPSHAEHRLTIERELFLTAVRRVALIAREEQNTIQLCFENNRIEISTEAQDVGEAHESVVVRYEGEAIVATYDPDFLMEPLKNIQSDEIYFEISDALSPGVIKTNVPFIYVIMPMRIS